MTPVLSSIMGSGTVKPLDYLPYDTNWATPPFQGFIIVNWAMIWAAGTFKLLTSVRRYPIKSMAHPVTTGGYALRRALKASAARLTTIPRKTDRFHRSRAPNIFVR